MTTPPFRYEGYQIDPARGLLTCRYSVGDYRFSERVTVPGAAPERWGREDVDEAARLVFLLAGVSYYKTAAPPVIDLGETAVTDTERAFLRAFYTGGLAEFGYRNGLDLSGLQIEGPARPSPARAGRTQSPETAGFGSNGPANPGRTAPGAVRRRHRLDRHHRDDPRPGRARAVHREPPG